MVYLSDDFAFKQFFFSKNVISILKIPPHKRSENRALQEGHKRTHTREHDVQQYAVVWAIKLTHVSSVWKQHRVMQYVCFLFSEEISQKIIVKLIQRYKNSFGEHLEGLKYVRMVYVIFTEPEFWMDRLTLTFFISEEKSPVGTVVNKQIIFLHQCSCPY